MTLSQPDTVHSAFATAFQGRDVDALVDLYEPEAVQVQQDGTLISGHDALRAVFQGLLDAGLTMQGGQRMTAVSGDVALTSTHYTFPAPDGEPGGTTTHVFTAEVTRRQDDGTWRVAIDAPFFVSTTT